MNIYKPSGPTSHDIVDQVRLITGIKKVGHAGTLDPIACGVLIVLVGKETTKRQKEFLEMDKEYVAKIRLGATSTTDDGTGILKVSKCQGIRVSEIRKTIKTFIGEIEQVPPIYSAKKIRGKKAYELARKGKTPKLKPKKVKIYKIELLKYSWPHLDIKVKCSSGTYIRALARDIGKKLECGAFLEELTRTAVGNFKIKNSLKLENLKMGLALKQIKC